MTEKRNTMKTLIDDAINNSLEFEKLMDETDFDSWLDDDNSNDLKGSGQDPTPFKKFKENIKKLEGFFNGMTTNESGDKSSLDKHFPSKLYQSKIERLKARKSPKKESEIKCYKEAQKILLDLLNFVQGLKINENDEKYILILIYNDLSICYAGLENSSISRGYAEEARKRIERDQSYKDFEKKFNANESIEKDKFLSSKLYDLYTITIFNQALAEKRSYMFFESEKNFKKIIKYATPPIKGENYLLNFNFRSAIVNLSDLYNDQGRGKESIKLLDLIIKLPDDEDIRYCNAYLNNITALIDQCDYREANKRLLEKFIEKKGNGLTLRKRHTVTASGFRGMNYYARCQIEKVNNTLKLTPYNKKIALKKAENFIIDNIKLIHDREQKGLEAKAYKYLSDIYKIIDKNKEKSSENLIKYFSVGEVNSLQLFVQHEDMDKWISNCDDLNALESLFKITRTNIKGVNDGDPIGKLFEKLKDKIIRECDEKGQFSRSEKIMREYNEELEEGEDGNKIEYENDVFDETDKINKDCIRKRLDLNEKKFDSVLFERKDLKQEDNLVEVIILRRWNSFSPGLLGSSGGGYLLRFKNLGSTNKKEKCHNIVIDPGYSFLQNFRSEGFLIDDIDTIIITHSHIDHCAELLPIMDLIYQINNRYEKYNNKKKRDRKRINLCLSKGTYNKFSSYTTDRNWQMQLKDVIIIENLPDRKWEINDGLTLIAIPTAHMDLGGEKAIGLKIIVKRKSKDLCLGFTGDTRWYKDIKIDFSGCDLLCVHLGSIKYPEIGYSNEIYKAERKELKNTQKEKELKNMHDKANHLLFFGTKKLIDACSNENNLIIVGEFGEELKYGLRDALCKKLSSSSRQYLPCDIGLYIAIDKKGTKRIRCCFCESFVRPDEITTFSYGREDAIHYICKTCGNTLTNLQKQAVIEHRVTRH